MGPREKSRRYQRRTRGTELWLTRGLSGKRRNQFRSNPLRGGGGVLFAFRSMRERESGVASRMGEDLFRDRVSRGLFEIRCGT